MGSLSGINGKIEALNSKKTATQNDNSALAANINQLQTEEIPNAQTRLKETQDECAGLSAEQREKGKIASGLDAECNDLAKDQETLLKRLEDVKMKEDRKKTENEHLRKDIEDFKKRIKENEERKEQERLDEENAEKERLKKYESEQKTEEEKPSDIRVDAPRKRSLSNNDPNSPLVNKSKPNEAQSGCACCTIL